VGWGDGGGLVEGFFESEDSRVIRDRDCDCLAAKTDLQRDCFLRLVVVLSYLGHHRLAVSRDRDELLLIA
jgi:hypothetical protein